MEDRRWACASSAVGWALARVGERTTNGTRREWGHLALAIGDGRVVHALEVVRVDDARAIEGLSLGAGWSAPRLIGWTGSERLLEGSRPRNRSGSPRDG